MTMMTLQTKDSTGRLEGLVDRILAALFPPESEPSETAPDLVRIVHEARRLRQSVDLDGALEAFNKVDTSQAPDTELRWLYAEWLDIARRRFARHNALLYSPATGRAGVLFPTEGGDGTLVVMTTLGLRWPVGKRVSRRSLRGLKPLAKKGGEA